MRVAKGLSYPLLWKFSMLLDFFTICFNVQRIQRPFCFQKFPLSRVCLGIWKILYSLLSYTTLALYTFKLGKSHIHLFQKFPLTRVCFEIRKILRLLFSKISLVSHAPKNSQGTSYSPLQGNYPSRFPRSTCSVYIQRLVEDHSARNYPSLDIRVHCLAMLWPYRCNFVETLPRLTLGSAPTNASIADDG